MSFAAAAGAMRQRMADNWTATPVVYENQDFTPTAGESFVYFEVVGGGGDQITLGPAGAQRFRKTGLMQAHVFVPVGAGDGLARTHADAIAAIFQAQDFAGVLCRAASVGVGERADDNGQRTAGTFWRVTVTVPFQFDEIA